MHDQIIIVVILLCYRCSRLKCSLLKVLAQLPSLPRTSDLECICYCILSCKYTCL